MWKSMALGCALAALVVSATTVVFLPWYVGHKICYSSSIVPVKTTLPNQVYEIAGTEIAYEFNVVKYNQCLKGQ